MLYPLRGMVTVWLAVSVFQVVINGSWSDCAWAAPNCPGRAASPAAPPAWAKRKTRAIAVASRPGRMKLPLRASQDGQGIRVRCILQRILACVIKPIVRGSSCKDGRSLQMAQIRPAHRTVAAGRPECWPAGKGGPTTEYINKNRYHFRKIFWTTSCPSRAAPFFETGRWRSSPRVRWGTAAASCRSCSPHSGEACCIRGRPGGPPPPPA